MARGDIRHCLYDEVAVLTVILLRPELLLCTIGELKEEIREWHVATLSDVQLKYKISKCLEWVTQELRRTCENSKDNIFEYINKASYIQYVLCEPCVRWSLYIGNSLLLKSKAFEFQNTFKTASTCSVLFSTSPLSSYWSEHFPDFHKGFAKTGKGSTNGKRVITLLDLKFL
jgi:hypothetical protein